MTRQSTRRKRLKLVGDGGDSCELVGDGVDLFTVFNGERIVKLGQPNTPLAETWVSLVPGYSITDNPGLGELTVTSNVCEQ